MRTIKFRAWDKKEEIMGDEFNLVDIVDSDLDENSNEWFDIVNNSEKNNFILMQFTGLKDKNGVEIYEGDILSGDYPDKVFWDNNEGQWMVWSVENPDYPLCLNLRDYDSKVIGNIYVNKELCEKQNNN